jgi:hypothetical protein
MAESTLVSKKVSRTSYDANGNPVTIYGIVESVIPGGTEGEVLIVVRRVDAVHEKDNGILRAWVLRVPTAPDDVVRVID